MTRLLEYARLMRLDRPHGPWLLLGPALWARWISADGQPGERVFAIFVAGTFLMRAAGCVINDYPDRRDHPHLPPTPARALALRRRGRSRAARCRRPRRSGWSWCLPVLRCC